eukprot:10771823-Ditylum_brightwellii.AAC.1
MLSCVSKFEDTKEQGVGKNKRKWVIKVNDARTITWGTAVANTGTHQRFMAKHWWLPLPMTFTLRNAHQKLYRG